MQSTYEAMVAAAIVVSCHSIPNMTANSTGKDGLLRVVSAHDSVANTKLCDKCLIEKADSLPNKTFKVKKL